MAFDDLMASFVKNINDQDLVTGFQVTIENVGDVFWDTVYSGQLSCINDNQEKEENNLKSQLHKNKR